MQNNKLFFDSTIGIIGGGQLGRMMTTAAKHMGYRVVVLDPTPDCPTAQVADDQIVAAYDDLEAIEQLAGKSDVITYEFENVDVNAAQILEEKGILPQGAHSLRVTQDRELEKQAMVDSDQPVSDFAIVRSEDDLRNEAKQIGFPSVVKTCRGGYDGKGQVKLTSEADIDEAIDMLHQAGRVIIEKWVPFDKEISIIFTRTIDGDISYFPVAENNHRDHILHATIAPGRVSEAVAEKARQAAAAIAETIGVVGTFAIEMFVSGENVLINEMAPRPHNSGHYTIEACSVSQFEQHIRAICRLPLAPIHFHGGAVMVNLLGKDVTPFFDQFVTEMPNAHPHMYGKQENKPQRKMGHATFIGEDPVKIYNELVDKKIIED
ncbi:phosphoribosylaminoimidazole carboxylase ATPase subunit [Gracilibacillus halophilus YIM-C55.5]|uniref:N5-carboxyaminoimidazole ribonucleotide synthase n=1 Tax=Gracilibacillus halophilus YIM-C55.5 TaxID=1308866 RepID=N4WUG1_9BACI|nr:5-(carboxyamino)imidazole ribonucleotide synthase [Gracilibacillus halophilus]ENH96761.1 phosphoribosylaminoimidazole carboxylase ATPase subunit [Gracilibacillus halophilus YIM-C55.5]